MLTQWQRIAFFSVLTPHSAIRLPHAPKKIQATAETADCDPGCHTFPTDFGLALATIGQRPTTWLNFYQTDSPLLHSDQTPGAKNFQMEYGAGNLEAHGDVPRDPTVAAQVAQLIATAVGGATAASGAGNTALSSAASNGTVGTAH